MILSEGLALLSATNVGLICLSTCIQLYTINYFHLTPEYDSYLSQVLRHGYCLDQHIRPVGVGSLKDTL